MSDEQGRQLPLMPGQDDGGDALRRAVQPKGPGRPPGSPNQRTEAVVDYMLSRYRSPLEALAKAYSMPLADLVKVMQDAAETAGLSKKMTTRDLLDLLRLQISAAKELAPYLHQKQPTAIEVDNSGVIPISIMVDPGLANEPGLAHALQGDSLTLDARVVNNEENQGVSDDDDDVSDASKLDAGSNDE